MLEKDESKKRKVTLTENEMQLILESVENGGWPGKHSHLVTSVRSKMDFQRKVTVDISIRDA